MSSLLCIFQMPEYWPRWGIHIPQVLQCSTDDNFISWTSVLCQKLSMNNTPLGKGSSFSVRWQMIQLQNSILFTDITDHFRYQLCQMVLWETEATVKLKVQNKQTKSIREKYKWNKKAKGTRTPKESLQNVMKVWLLWKKEVHMIGYDEPHTAVQLWENLS